MRTAGEDVLFAVTVEVADADEAAEGGLWDGVGGWGSENARSASLVEENDGAGLGGDDYVEVAITVEVDWGDERLCAGDSVVRGFLKGAVAVAEEDRDEAFGADECDVQLFVVVHVGDREGGDRGAGQGVGDDGCWICGALIEKYGQRGELLAWCGCGWRGVDEVGLSIAVEVADCGGRYGADGERVGDGEDWWLTLGDGWNLG